MGLKYWRYIHGGDDSVTLGWRIVSETDVKARAEGSNPTPPHKINDHVYMSEAKLQVGGHRLEIARKKDGLCQTLRMTCARGWLDAQMRSDLSTTSCHGTDHGLPLDYKFRRKPACQGKRLADDDKDNGIETEHMIKIRIITGTFLLNTSSFSMCRSLQDNASPRLPISCGA